MFAECKRQEDLKSLAIQSMSCGKSGRINMHCGRCVPCIIRRAAFHRAGIADTTHYKCGPSTDLDGFRSADDVRCAFIGSARHTDRKWVERVTMPALFECDIEDRNGLIDVVARGLKEVHEFLVASLK